MTIQLRAIYQNGNLRLLDPVELQEGQEVKVTIEAGEQPRLTPRQIMKLPAEERRRIMADSFALAANEDFEIFEAYGEEGEDFDDLD